MNAARNYDQQQPFRVRCRLMHIKVVFYNCELHMYLFLFLSLRNCSTHDSPCVPRTETWFHLSLSELYHNSEDKHCKVSVDSYTSEEWERRRRESREGMRQFLAIKNGDLEYNFIVSTAHAVSSNSSDALPSWSLWQLTLGTKWPTILFADFLIRNHLAIAPFSLG